MTTTTTVEILLIARENRGRFGDKDTLTYRARTGDPYVATRRAIERFWGTAARLHTDWGLTVHGGSIYGQVVRPVGRSNPGCWSCLTGRVRISTTTEGEG